MPPLLYQRHRLLATTLISAALTTMLIVAPVSAQTRLPGSTTSKSVGGIVPQWRLLAGSVVPQLRTAHRLHALAASKQLGLTVTLRVRDQNALSQFVAAVQDPASPLYRHYLTPRTFAQRFAPTTVAREHTTTWLQSLGLHIVSTSSNGLQITVRGSAANVQSAFNTPLATYQQGNHTFVANSQALRIPGSVAPDILAVSGLSTAAQQQPATSVRALSAAAPQGFSPADVANIYDLTPLSAQRIAGSGQTVAVISFADYAASNISVFDQQFGLASTVTRIPVSDGVTSGAPLGQRNGQAEAESDIELVQGAAPRATVLVYEAPNTNEGALALYNRIVSDNRAAVVTTSWGAVESSYSTDDINAIHQTLTEAAAQGQTFLSASGDSGAYDGTGTAPNGNTTLAVDYPASDPLVTGVGGTTLSANGAQYAGESAWSDASDPSNPVGSGGGLSAIFPRPSYQTGPGVSNSFSNGMRQVPDVAANADPNTGFALYTVNPHNVPGWGVGGGTSASTPLWAGLVALVNEATGRRQGAWNLLLYELGQKATTFSQAPFHDVTQGSNLHYPATSGWDYATGWGSFDGAAFVADLKTLPAPPPFVTPTVTATPVPTPTIASLPPSITIKQVILLHVVKGKSQPTSALKVGETGTLVILYQKSRAGSLAASGRISVQQKGKAIRTVVTTPSSYQGKAALIGIVHFTSVKRIGNLLAHVTVTLGTVSSSLNHTFKLIPTK